MKVGSWDSKYKDYRKLKGLCQLKSAANHGLRHHEFSGDKRGAPNLSGAFTHEKIQCFSHGGHSKVKGRVVPRRRIDFMKALFMGCDLVQPVGVQEQPIQGVARRFSFPQNILFYVG